MLMHILTSITLDLRWGCDNLEKLLKVLIYIRVPPRGIGKNKQEV